MIRHRGTRIALGSQIASSLTSLLAGIAVARVGTVDEFGAFGLVFGTYLLVSTLLKSFLVEPLVVAVHRTPGLPSDHGALLGACVLLSAPCAVVLAVALSFGDLPFDALAICTAALAMLFAVVQETFKAYCFGVGREFVAMLSDGIWCLAQLVVLGLAIDGRISAYGAMTGWGIGALAGLAAAALALPAAPKLARGGALAWTGRRLGFSWVVDSAMDNSLGMAIPWLLGAIAALSEVASFRGALTLLGPTTVMLGGLRLAALPVLARSEPDHVRSLAGNLSLICAALTVAVGLPLLIMPSSIGVQLLGDSWKASESVLLYAVLWRLATAVTMPLQIALRAIGETRSILVVRAVTSALTVVVAYSAAVVDGARGAFVGLTFVSVVALPMLLRTLARATASRPLDPATA